MANPKSGLWIPVVAILVAPGCGKTDVLSAGAGGKQSTPAGGGIGSGGAISAGGTEGQGGVIITGGNGSGGTGGGGGGQTGTVVGARVPAVHRPKAVSCAGVFAPGEPYNPQYGDCKTHADCARGTNGRCIHGTVGMSANRYYCVYDQCATDSDCDTGRVCYCTGSDSPRCLSLGNCLADADCGSGAYSYCSPSNGFDCAGYHSIDSYYCHTPNDTCIDDSDCGGNRYCNYSMTEGRWTCFSPQMTCAIG